MIGKTLKVNSNELTKIQTNISIVNPITFADLFTVLIDEDIADELAKYFEFSAYENLCEIFSNGGKGLPLSKRSTFRSKYSVILILEYLGFLLIVCLMLIALFHI